MNLYISDLHFGHKNVINFDHRPFRDVDEMDSVLIKLWNSRVDKDDTVYIVGDLCYRSSNPPEWYLRQLKGHKVLIMGNHDTNTVKNANAVKYLEGVDKMMHVTDGDKQICLCHFPIVEWNGYFRGSWHIYGHIHNSRNRAFEIMKNEDRALNAGCMINNYTPASINELIHNNRLFKEDKTLRD